MRINPVYTTYQHRKPSFKNNHSAEFSSQTRAGILNHETYFFREAETDRYIQDYIRENFCKNKSITIVSAACSSGEEARSYAMMLDDLSPRLKIYGFDIDQNSINAAKKASYMVLGNEVDIFSSQDDMFGYLEKCKDKFHKYFIPTGKIELPEENAFLKRLKIFNIRYYRNAIREATRTEYKLKSGALKNCSFFKGDIQNLESYFNKDDIDVLLFRNAWYHLLCDNERNKAPDRYETAQKIIKMMHKTLKPQGLVVFGELEKGQGTDVNMLSDLMLENGFKPVIINPELTSKLLLMSGRDDNMWKTSHIWQKVK